MVKVKVPWEPELLDPWKAAWDRLIWKARILKVKAIEGELNRNPRSFKAGRSQIHYRTKRRRKSCLGQKYVLPGQRIARQCSRFADKPGSGETISSMFGTSGCAIQRGSCLSQR